MDGDRNMKRYPKPTAGEKAEKKVGPAKDKDSGGSPGAKADNTESKTNDGETLTRQLHEREELHKAHGAERDLMHKRHVAEFKEVMAEPTKI